MVSELSLDKGSNNRLSQFYRNLVAEARNLYYIFPLMFLGGVTGMEIGEKLSELFSCAPDSLNGSFCQAAQNAQWGGKGYVAGIAVPAVVIGAVRFGKPLVERIRSAMNDF